MSKVEMAINAMKKPRPDKMYIVQGRGSGIGWNDCSSPLNIIDAQSKQKDLFAGVMSGTTGGIGDWTRIVPVDEANCVYN